MVYSSDSATLYPHLGDTELYTNGTRPELIIMKHFIFAVYFSLFTYVTVEIARAGGKKL